MLDYARLFDLLIEGMDDDESHIERNPHVFHPSQLGNTCIRQVYLQKLGLVDLDPGPLRAGTIIHELIERELPALAEDHPDELRELGIRPAHVDALEYEQSVSADLGGIVLTGRYDLYDPIEDVIVDWKTVSRFYWLDTPVDEHIEQLLLYLFLADVEQGQLVYIQRTDLATKPYPAAADPRDTVPFDEARFRSLIARAWRVREAIKSHGIATTPAEIPFPRCGCWKCEQEAEALALPDEPPPLAPAPESDPSPVLAEPTPGDSPAE